MMFLLDIIPNKSRHAVNTSELAILMSQFMTDAFTRLRCSGFVSVCLINGSAVGGGAEIATVCDYRYKIIFTEYVFHLSEHYYIV
jgi:enoyl-CoA hydratase/carnithine racemase